MNKFILADINQGLVDAWKEEFQEHENFEFYCGNVFDKKADFIASPANSFGFMNGGIELAYSNTMGWHIQKEFQDLIKEKYDGEILIGQSCIINTNYENFPKIILAPTMRVPMYLEGSPNVYLSAKAIFLAMKRNSQEGESCLIPGLGTGCGYVPYKVCAQKMRMAYEDFYLGKSIFPAKLMIANIKHMEEIS